MDKNISYYNSLDSFISKCENDTSCYMLYVAENCSFNYNVLKKTTIKFYGAIFPEVIFENKNYSQGLIAFKIPSLSEALIIRNIGNFKRTPILQDYNSIIAIVDGLSSNISYFLEHLFESLNDDSEIIGGGAGKLTLKQEPVIFSNENIYQDAALLLGIKKDIHVGVKHGWNYLEGPFIAT